MTDNEGGLRSRLFSGTTGATEESFLEEIERYVDPEENIKHRLTGTSALEYEHDGRTERMPTAGNGDPYGVLTDRRIIFVVVSSAEKTVTEVTYTDVRGIDVDDGLLHSALTVDVWPEGTYKFEAVDEESVAAAVAYVRDASRCWDYVIAKADEANEKLPAVVEHVEEGRLGRAQETRDEVRQSIDRAREKLAEVDIEPIPPLVDRIDDAERELQRTEMQARLARAKGLMTKADHQAEEGEYTEAFRRYWKARDQLENARMLARRADIEEPQVLDSEFEAVESRIENISVRPIAQAKQAHERAQRTRGLDNRIEALEDAFEHYRSALVAGWGTNFEFAGDKEAIRETIESVLDELVTARCERAENRIEAGDDDKESPFVQRRYERAAADLERARALAREFRAGDEDAVAALSERLPQ